MHNGLLLLLLLLILASCNATDNNKQGNKKSFKIEEVLIVHSERSFPRLGVKIKCYGITNPDEISQVNIYGVNDESQMSTYLVDADSLFIIYVNEPYHVSCTIEEDLLKFNKNRVFARLIINDTSYYAECDTFTKFYIKQGGTGVF
jgi:hypothetical protein